MNRVAPETAVTKDGRVVTLHTRTVGQSFATYGIVKLGSRVLGESRPVPYGFTAAALDDARALATTLTVEVQP